MRRVGSARQAEPVSCPLKFEEPDNAADERLIGALKNEMYHRAGIP